VGPREMSFQMPLVTMDYELQTPLDRRKKELL